MLRVLIADDQIPDEHVSDSQILSWARENYPKAHDGFINAFAVMRQAVNTLRDGCDVKVARRYREVLSLIKQERFDVAIVDLGWAGDGDVPRNLERTAGWQLVDAITKEDAQHPERPPTALIIYSSRFETDPSLGQEAAARGILPFYKPYGERFSLPLDDAPVALDRKERTRVACEALKGAVKFIEQLRNRRVERLLRSAEEGLARATNRERQWHRLTLSMVAVGILAVFAGLVVSLFVSVQEGAVSSASGVVIAIIPKLLYRRLDIAYAQIKEARQNLADLLKETRG